MRNLWCRLFHSGHELVTNSYIGTMIYDRTFGAYRPIIYFFVCLKCGKKWTERIG